MLKRKIKKEQTNFRFNILTIIIYIIGIILIVTKIKKSDEYIPFGPFIVIATFISIFVPFDVLLKILLVIFTLGTYKAV